VYNTRHKLLGEDRTEKQQEASRRHSNIMKRKARELNLADNLPSQKGRVRSEESKLKYKKAAENRPMLVCPHCNKSGKGPEMRKWHFDNCKFKV